MPRPPAMSGDSTIATAGPRHVRRLGRNHRQSGRSHGDGQGRLLRPYGGKKPTSAATTSCRRSISPAACWHRGGDGLAYTYYNTGLVASETSSSDQSYVNENGVGGDPDFTVYYTDWTGETYGYDANGNRVHEATTAYHNVRNDSGESRGPKDRPGLFTTTQEDATVTYDAMNRMASYDETAGTPATIALGNTTSTATSAIWRRPTPRLPTRAAPAPPARRITGTNTMR